MNACSLLLGLVTITLFTCACATAPRGASAPTSGSPRARCLVDPNEGGTRPLFYLLCIESP